MPILLLVASITAVYLPFLNARILRMAGDEKVYISTAIEMHRQGYWFLNTIAEKPDYYKGPFHYLCMQVGLSIFGNELIAGLWMNYVLLVLLGLAFYDLGSRRWNKQAGFFLALAATLNIGVFSHAFASQMEVEVTTLMGLCIWALARQKMLSFWLLAGVLGWVKSPLYSVFAALSGVLYLAWDGQLKKLLHASKFWLSALAGIALGIAGYLPALILDYKNFYATFILREQFQKGGNNRSWDYVVIPLFYFALPWTFAMVRGALAKVRDKQMMRLGASFSIPIILFWACWQYKGQNYNLPTLPALALLGLAALNGDTKQIAFRWMAALTSVAAALMGFVIWHFHPLPEWWNTGWVIGALFFIAASIASFVRVKNFHANPQLAAAGVVSFFLAFLCVVTPLGTRELLDMQKFIQENPRTNLYYDNLEPSIWNEWGLMQLALHKTIQGVHRDEQIAQAVRSGSAVIVRNKLRRDFFLSQLSKLHPGKKATVTPWKRWMTKGKAEDGHGESMWKAAWREKRIDLLERDFYVISVM